MKKDQDVREKGNKALRECAEQLFETQKAGKKATEDKMSPPEIRRLVQELHIHQIELEMQNEELKRTRDEAEAERERYLDLYDFAPVSYFTLERKGMISQVNLAGAKLLGIERSRLLGNAFRNFILTSDLGVFDAFLKEVFASQGKVNCSFSIGAGMDKLIHVQMEAALTEDRQQCRVAVMDVTERKNAEDNLRKLRKELEDRVAERTNAVKELESFSYSVSHDLQTPLRAIDGYTRMILREQGDHLDDITRRKLDLVRQNTKRMGHLIEHLLEFSRLGRRYLSKAEINMSDAVNEAWENLKIVYCDKTMTLKCDYLPPAIGDGTLIGQVVNNILANAIKFTRPQNDVIVEVGACRKDAEIIYFIRDNGVGFDMAYYNKLFKMFQRLHSPEEFGGMGIGLAMAHRIITMHGGRIWADAKENEGATFYFSLPSADSGAGIDA